MLCHFCFLGYYFLTSRQGKYINHNEFSWKQIFLIIVWMLNLFSNQLNYYSIKIFALTKLAWSSRLNNKAIIQLLKNNMQKSCDNVQVENKNSLLKISFQYIVQTHSKM